MEFKIMEAPMLTEREREGRITAAENRGEAAIAIAIAVGGNTKLTRPCTLQLRGSGRAGRERNMPWRPGP
jgi:hypothetical protein